MANIKSKCEGCEYNERTYGKRFWKCNHPIPCEDRKISEYGCKEAKPKTYCDGTPVKKVYSESLDSFKLGEIVFKALKNGLGISDKK